MAEVVTPAESQSIESKKVWTTLITNTTYLSGLLTLDHSLKRVGSKYLLVALYTDTFPEEGLKALRDRKIPHQKVNYLQPSMQKDYSNDPRFYDCWTKLIPFSMTQYERLVQLDSDMLVLQNMDELMELQLDPPEMTGKGDRVFAGSHACACNPLKKAHYPKDWIPENCAFTTQHSDPDKAQNEGAACTAGFGMVNGGLLVINPCQAIYNAILEGMTTSSVMEYDFADQSLLSDLFGGRWVAIPYIYNALKTLAWENVHASIWREDRVKNIHFILSPKPWDEKSGDVKYEIHQRWWDINLERLEAEKKNGIDDGF